MAMTRHPMRVVVSTAVGFGFALSLVGCDYWPPALQAEIEQLRSEAQTLTIEKTQLQAQVTDLSQTKQELQGQFDEMSRISREKTGMITSLQNQLDATRARALKAMTPKTPPHKNQAKPTGKTATKLPTKSTPKTSTGKHQAPRAIGVR
jgi:septal ring factor EnvC (AmiA/AmiB activator)